jgi:hypothetical protein
MDTQPMEIEVVRFRDEFGAYGIRKILALMIIAGVVLWPVGQWLRGEPQPAAGFRSGPPSRWAQAEEEPKVRVFSWRTIFTTIVVAFALMFYYPRWGYKRYALLAAPLIAFGAPWVLSWYLEDRTTVYRFEVVVAAWIGALPGAALYLWLAWRKARRRGMVW